MKIKALPLNIVMIFIFLSLTMGLSAATIRDKTGDFGDTDVISVQVDIVGQSAAFTITYSEEVISSMWGGAGGIIGIDSDRNLLTGLDSSRGFDCQITFNVIALAPSAKLDIWTGGNSGRTVRIGSQFGNGTDLSFTDRTVRLVVPLQYMGTNGDFDFVLFATGALSTGDKWDRVPDNGAVRSSTGEVTIMQVSGNKSPRTYQARPLPGRKLLVQSVTASIEGENAVWLIQTGVDLPGNSFSDDSMTMNLLIDVDRRLETGIESTDIPFLPFGADRNVRCTFTPGGARSIDVVVGINKDNGERIGRGGGSGVNDLTATFTRRQARLVIPLWLLGINSTAFDWMLLANSTEQKRATEIFLNTSIRFDTGEMMLPLEWPQRVVTVPDPVDAKKINIDPQGRKIQITRTLPNSELRQLKAAIRPGYLMAHLTYEYPITLEPHYLTALNILVPGNGGVRRHFLASMNWHPTFGGQVVLREMTAGADITRANPINQCLATQGKNAFLLLPAAVFGVNALKGVQISVETSQIAYSIVAGRTVAPTPGGGGARFGAHVGLVAGGQTTLAIDSLPDSGAYIDLR